MNESHERGVSASSSSAARERGNRTRIVHYLEARKSSKVKSLASSTRSSSAAGKRKPPRALVVAAFAAFVLGSPRLARWNASISRGISATKRARRRVST